MKHSKKELIRIATPIFFFDGKNTRIVEHGDPEHEEYFKHQEKTSDCILFDDPRKTMNNPKLLIIGHARHGKDTVAEILRDTHGYDFVSSSEFVAREIIWEDWGKDRYADFDEMFADRVNHRTHWANMITAYNTPDKTKTASTMIQRGHDMYVGMRRRDELKACKDANIFDYIVWVDRSKHLPDEPPESMDLCMTDCDYVIDNNGSLEDLHTEVRMLVEELSAGLVEQVRVSGDENTIVEEF